MEINFTYSPSKSEIETIYNGLVEFNANNFKELNEIQFGAFIRDENGNIVGGVTGKSLYTTFHISYFWISEPFRSKGLGKELIQSVESKQRKMEFLIFSWKHTAFKHLIFTVGLASKKLGAILTTLRLE